jgi:hypothetical protein
MMMHERPGLHRGSAWPVPFGLSLHELALFGAEHGVLHEQPVSGDVFLQRGFGRESSFTLVFEEASSLRRVT